MLFNTGESSPTEYDGSIPNSYELFEALKLIFSRPDLNNKEKEMAIEELVHREKTLRIMAFGLMGAGKSTLLNGIIGRPLFKVGDLLKHETLKIEQKKIEDGIYTLIAYDTPGLNDSTGGKEEYIASIRTQCDIDVFLYCIKITSSRPNRTVLNFNATILKELKKALKNEVWGHCVVVLTFANSIVMECEEHHKDVKKEFEKAIIGWKESVQKSLKEADISTEKITIVPVGAIKKPSLLNDADYWLSNLYHAVYDAASEDGQDVLTYFNTGRIKRRKDVKDKHFETDLHDQPIVPPKMWDKFKAHFQTRFPTLAAAIGSGGVAGVTGATIGATIGALAIGIPSFGVAAGVGLLLGAAIGGGSGIGIGILTAKAISKVKRHQNEKKDETDKSE